MKTFGTSFEGFELTLFEEDGISEGIRAGRAWEPHVADLLDTFVKPGQTVCDAGANFGIHTLRMSRLVGASGTVFAFEPYPIIFLQLCHNLFANAAFNVRAVPSALGERSGRSVMPRPEKLASFNLGATPIGEGEISIEITALDHYANHRFSFIKVDVQGCETMLLRGGNGIISRDRPMICVEIEEPWLRRLGSSSKELIEHLFALDYALLRIETDYPCDHLAVPIESFDIARAALAAYAWPLTIVRGKEIELSFGDQPFYESFRIVR